MGRDLSEVGEFELIERLVAVLGETSAIGDDCAVVPLERLGGGGRGWLLASVDNLVQDRHFRLHSFRPADLGYKLVAASLSDIAAMGGIPHGALISISLPSATAEEWVVELYRGVDEAGRRWRCPILGGNTSAAGEINLAATVFGWSDSPPLMRSGAQDRDDLWLTGPVGLSGLGLRLLTGEIPSGRLSATEEEMLKLKHLCPTPQLELGMAIRQIAHAAIDISDGLLQDASHLAKQSKCLLTIESHRITDCELVKRTGYTVAEAASFGEDYEILFTAPLSARQQLSQLGFSALRRIGSCLKGDGGVELMGGERSGSGGGFDHFSVNEKKE